MGFRYVADQSSLSVGAMKKFDVDGVQVLLIHLQEGFFATQAKCPHMLLPLEKGHLMDDCKLQCKFHRAEFDIKTGKAEKWANFPPGIQALNFLRGEKDLMTYRTKVEDGRVYVEING